MPTTTTSARTALPEERYVLTEDFLTALERLRPKAVAVLRRKGITEAMLCRGERRCRLRFPSLPLFWEGQETGEMEGFDRAVDIEDALIVLDFPPEAMIVE